MKEFLKINNLFICQECLKKLKSKYALSNHISKKHSSIKEYYDKWLKEDNEGICKTCSKETKFLKLKGYRLFCNVKCANKNEIISNKIKNSKILKYGDYNNIEKRFLTNLKKYGAKNGFESEIIKNKIKQTLQKKYNVNNSYKIKNIREKALINAHSEKANIKRKNTNLKKWGCENPLQSEIIKNKIKQSNLKKYGVEHNHQNAKVLEKSLKTSFKIKYFRNTKIYYQGSYELDFLEKYYDKYPDIQRGPVIKYKFNDKYHYYHSDFYIPSKNLIIECKCTYYYNKFLEKNKAKEFAVKNKKYNYILFLDKKGSI